MRANRSQHLVLSENNEPRLQSLRELGVTNERPSELLCKLGVRTHAAESTAVFIHARTCRDYTGGEMIRKK